ncbi:MAG TPA: VOC family protein [Phycisphaerae bacterium]|jgi:predicted enzyme related to lactoylglutathione lyase|nr:VOC family protein [Phycisphaerae bacterium]
MEHGIAEPSAAIRIDYVEFSVTDVQAAKRFYGGAFGWTFEDYGEGYAAFSCGNLTGGFAKADAVQRGGALVVLYAKDLMEMEERITAAGGRVVRPAFAFPGGRRFHFTDPSGNELAVWSDK